MTMRLRPSLAIGMLAVLLVWGGAVATLRSGVRVAAPARAQPASPLALTLPNKPHTLKFAVLGDFGTGDREQYDLAKVMARTQDQFPFELVILVGDNLYGSQRPQDYQKKFEIPYKPLLDKGVKFYASLGNHDATEQRFYKLFNMDGQKYYTFKAPKESVRFFVLETSYLEPDQVKWLEKELEASGEHWKIAYFHHPPYSSGERHGSDPRIREDLEPLFIKNKVSVVFTGHDHFYERTKPQNGIVYFVVGAGGKLRRGNIDKRSLLTAKGMDTDQSFMVAEIDKDEMHFNAISRGAQVFDSGVLTRQK
jgi:calcineurin-like phosphoesterase family protein